MFRRFAAIVFSFLVMLSGGMVQAAVHVCKDRCDISHCEHGHEQLPAQVPDCCKTVNETEPDCCEDLYFIALSPKFGQVQEIRLTNPGLEYVPGQEHFSLSSVFTSLTENRSERLNSFSYLCSGIRPLICIWRI